jgi:phosphomannomutase
MDQSIFKAYDIRGKYGTQVNQAVAVEVGKACKQLWKPGKIVIAHDIRHGSVELAEAVIEGIKQISESGLNKDVLNQGTPLAYEIIFIGLSTTPMFYFLVNELGASGGCMITASHNPKEYNGFKIVSEKAETISGLTVRDVISKKI